MSTPNPYSSPDADDLSNDDYAYKSKLGWGFAVSCVLTLLLVFMLPMGFYVYARAWIATAVGALCVASSLLTVRRGGWGCAAPLLLVTLLLVLTAWAMTPIWLDYFGFILHNEYDAQ